jgi:hypothetical protein
LRRIKKIVIEPQFEDSEIEEQIENSSYNQWRGQVERIHHRVDFILTNMITKNTATVKTKIIEIRIVWNNMIMIEIHHDVKTAVEWDI